VRPDTDLLQEKQFGIFPETGVIQATLQEGKDTVADNTPENSTEP
jgi:hypothetical protein